LFNLQKNLNFSDDQVKRFVLYRTFMMNDPDQTLYKLYVSKDLDVQKLDKLNFRFGIDDSQPAPENPIVMKRTWKRLENY
jgi:hypothetical protein